MKLTLFFIVNILIMTSCSTSVDSASSNKNPEYVYQGAGIEQYFLPELPVWANFSVMSQCRRETTLRYLNFQNLRKSYSLSYDEIIHFQNMFNRKLVQFKKNNPTAPLYLKDEAYIFNNAYQLLIGGSRDFLVPNYKKISLVWLDPYLSKKTNLKSLLNNEEVLSGFPILISTCLNSYEIESEVIKNKLDQFGVRYIGAEMFTPYTTEFSLGTMYSLDFNKILPEKDITLFAPYKPEHFLGIKKFKKR